jgi:N-acetylglutamate synthase-like GNAT family acetyltransferase
VNGGIQVRRAGKGDVSAIAVLMRTASPSNLEMAEAEVMEWLFGKGLWVAVQGDALLGVATWQVENLLSVTDVFQVASDRFLDTAGARLLEVIEEEARTLMCEANVLLLPAWTPNAVRTFLHGKGYERQELEDVHRIWREVLDEFIGDEPDLMVKWLRNRMVMVPI